MAFLQKNVHSFSPFSNTNRQDGSIKSILFPPAGFPAKRGPGGIGFLDEVGGSVDGLMSCTESLGFESSDERVDEQTFDEIICNNHSTVSRTRRPEHVRTEAKKFPPPLSSLDHNGKPTFFFRPVRKDGKLELQEVKISRPEVLCASRQDGRLRLHLVCSDEDEDDEGSDYEESYEEGEEEEDEILGEEEEKNEILGKSDDDERVEEIMETTEEEGWRISASPGSGGGGESFRRCHEVVRRRGNHHHHRPHHDFHVWNRHCVTIR